jgi:hypothetical protein
MAKKIFEIDKNEYLNSATFITNATLVFTLILFPFYLVVPLFVGKFSIYSIIKYGSLIPLSLITKLHVKRIRKGLRVRVHEYILGCFFIIVAFVIWFKYPLCVILSVLWIIGTVVAYRAAYRAQDKRLKEEVQGKKEEAPRKESKGVNP